MANDFFTLELAERLAHKVRLYWKKRGYAVNTRVEPFTLTEGDEAGQTLYHVRSDMVGGLPRDLVQPLSAVAA